MPSGDSWYNLIRGKWVFRGIFRQGKFHGKLIFRGNFSAKIVLANKL
jgi:hypothetical protein